MITKYFAHWFLLLAIVLYANLFWASADEGMWTLNGFPTQTVKKKYGFNATPAWLDHVRNASARLAGGCSGSFVSQNGLVMTNHHCAHSCIEQLSTESKDFIASGFYAKEIQDEVKCPEIEVNRLVKITDVTARVRKATAKLTGKTFNDELKAAMSKIEKECSGDSDSVRCEVVSLYHGGFYHLYKYQRYQDVRLVFAPELSVAFFGGDPDNFMFPRYDLDVSFLRVYDHGQPMPNDQYFRWSAQGAKENELTFVTGHPGSTSRLLTITELEFTRDVDMVKDLIYLAEQRGFITQFQKRGVEQKRISGARLFSVENSLKAFKGRAEALMDKKFFGEKIAAEKALRAKISANPEWNQKYGSAWKEIDEAYAELRKIYTRLEYTEQTNFGTRLFGIAKSLVRAAGELPKSNEKRFREFADSNLPQLKQKLFSAAPIYDEFELEMMTFALTKMREALTADDPFVKKFFGKKSPSEIAEEVIKGTKLKDVALRQKYWDGGQSAIDASTDPMIQLALLIDSDTRTIRKKYEDEIETKIKQASEKIAQAQFAVYGSNTYPDATFTLRISYGQIKGYSEKGQWVKPFTNIAGAFDRHTGRDPFALPETWLKAKNNLDLTTPLNFASTNDIIGGNSGSPVINKDAEVVGLIFDGNIQSLGGDYGFDGRMNRAVSVHSAAILEALEKIYGAKRIVEDIRGQKIANGG